MKFTIALVSAVLATAVAAENNGIASKNLDTELSSNVLIKRSPTPPTGEDGLDGTNNPQCTSCTKQDVEMDDLEAELDLVEPNQHEPTQQTEDSDIVAPDSHATYDVELVQTSDPDSLSPLATGDEDEEGEDDEDLALGDEDLSEAQVSDVSDEFNLTRRSSQCNGKPSGTCSGKPASPAVAPTKSCGSKPSSPCRNAAPPKDSFPPPLDQSPEIDAEEYTVLPMDESLPEIVTPPPTASKPPCSLSPAPSYVPDHPKVPIVAPTATLKPPCSLTPAPSYVPDHSKGPVVVPAYGYDLPPKYDTPPSPSKYEPMLPNPIRTPPAYGHDSLPSKYDTPAGRIVSPSKYAPMLPNPIHTPPIDGYDIPFGPTRTPDLGTPTPTSTNEIPDKSLPGYDDSILSGSSSITIGLSVLTGFVVALSFF
ncbi:hypothetical protein BASA61_009921 [Batrachochytrium salamandrivorans]|nr:hypothetical protein BASA61_009921 [Batrachochytrium salamandrivorans]